MNGGQEAALGVNRRPGFILFWTVEGITARQTTLTIDKCPVSREIVTVMGLDDGERLIGRAKNEVS